MTKVFKRWMILKGIIGSRCTPHHKDKYGATGRHKDRLQRRCQELTQAIPDQSVDDEAVYLNVAGECPKGRVYGLGSLGRKKRRYADPGASTSEMRIWCRVRVQCRCRATTKGYGVHARKISG
ncbi:hypothetical protein Sjap_023724 [Stephania japonica]|uniref:Uncharacterized protein n=1 Tax=Stephania japonica TaxID=461633 RepID=A0AAP0EFA5_9MAGN